MTKAAKELRASAKKIVDSNEENVVINEEVERLLKVLKPQEIKDMYWGTDESWDLDGEGEVTITGWAWELLEEYLAERLEEL